MLLKFSRLARLMPLTAVVFIAGCASNSPSSPQKIQQALELDTTNSMEQYTLGPTDVVRVSVWRNDDLSIAVPVRPDGKISVPLIGDVHATGETPEDLSSTIESRLSAYIREPQVSVVVTSMGSKEFADRVRVTGAVLQPVSVQHRAGMTVLDMFLTAGGANEFAAANNAMLYRPLNDEVIAIPVKLDDILSKGDIATNYPMRPGDILAVPERKF